MNPDHEYIQIAKIPGAKGFLVILNKNYHEANVLYGKRYFIGIARTAAKCH